MLGMKSDCRSFLNFTNNWLENLNGKLKQVIDQHTVVHWKKFLTSTVDRKIFHSKNISLLPRPTKINYAKYFHS